MDTQKSHWETSYARRQNFVFYPHEEVIRFISKHIRKRIGLHEFQDISANKGDRPIRLLDLGCGIGRHVVYGIEMGLEAYGIDLSEKAVVIARQWAGEMGVIKPEKFILAGDIRSLPWEAEYFDCAVSHGVLDSMHFDIAKDSCKEMHRVLRPGGLFYCDLISGDDTSHSREYSGEEIVGAEHERGTIQSYFNFEKILKLIGTAFSLVECRLIRMEDVVKGGFISRYHLILKRQ